MSFSGKFQSPGGCELQQLEAFRIAYHVRFNPLAGVSCSVTYQQWKSGTRSFQSSGGCELQRCKMTKLVYYVSFNPLAGVSCNLIGKTRMTNSWIGFNPLAGVSCSALALVDAQITEWFQSPGGCELQPESQIEFNVDSYQVSIPWRV